MSEAAAAVKEKRPAPWRGRKRVPDPRTKVVHIRCTPTKHAAYEAAATEAGLSVGAWFRAAADGAPGPRAVRRPPVEKETLARILGQLGKIGSNVNQLAYAQNATGEPPELRELAAARSALEDMRAALLKALGRGD